MEKKFTINGRTFRTESLLVGHSSLVCHDRYCSQENIDDHVVSFSYEGEEGILPPGETMMVEDGMSFQIKHKEE